MAAVVAAVLLAGVLVLIFGPARGARDDIAAVRDNVSEARRGIYQTLHVQQSTLKRLTQQLHALKESLHVQVASLHTARHTGRNVSRVVQEARKTELDTAAILRQAEMTLTQLQQSRQIQRQLLEVARQTLRQTRQINHKLPPKAPLAPGS